MKLAEADHEQIMALGQEVTAADTSAALTLSYIIHNGPQKEKTVKSLVKIYDVACEIGHDKWPQQVSSLVRSKDVLDYGCGTTLYGAVLRAHGARRYVGIDPRVDLDRTSYRSRIEKKTVKRSISLNNILAIIDNLDYYGYDIQAEQQFDVILMHTVTEHLSDVDSTFARLSQFLRPGGQMWFLHDNFYGWAGHHLAPHSVRAFDPNNPDHQRYADWAHVSNDINDDTFGDLNRIRLDDLKTVTSKYFDIMEWKEIREKSPVSTRLTPIIRNKLMNYSDRDLLTKHVICCATKSEAR